MKCISKVTNTCVNAMCLDVHESVRSVYSYKHINMYFGKVVSEKANEPLQMTCKFLSSDLFGMQHSVSQNLQNINWHLNNKFEYCNTMYVWRFLHARFHYLLCICNMNPILSLLLFHMVETFFVQKYSK